MIHTAVVSLHQLTPLFHRQWAIAGAPQHMEQAHCAGHSGQCRMRLILEKGSQPLWCIIKLHTPGIQQQHLVSHRQHILQPMFHQQDGQPQFPIQLLQCADKLRSGDRIQLGGGFIQQQHFRLHHHHRGEIQHLFLPTG